MKLRAVTSTSDGRLTRGKIYTGQMIGSYLSEARFLCFDDKGEWMTFAPSAFEPLDGGE